MTHHAGGAAGGGIGNKAAQAEIQHIVPGHYQQVVPDVLLFHGKQDVPDGAEARFIGFGPVVRHGDLRAAFRPFLKDLRELVVGDHCELIHPGVLLQVPDQPVQDGGGADLQQGLGKVFGQRVQPRRVSGGQDQAGHSFTPFALWQKWTENFPSSSGKRFRYFAVTDARTDSSSCGSTSAMQQPLKPAPEKRPP